MRYDQEAIYYDEKKQETDQKYNVNLTSLSVEKQIQIFGDMREERVTIRTVEQTSYKAGYFKINGVGYKILKRSNVQKGTSYYGAEYNGEL